MKWIVNTVMSVTFFAITLIVGLLLVNSVMTIAVAQTNHVVDRTIETGSEGKGVGISGSSGGFVISTNDGSMMLTGEGIEYMSG